MAFCIRSFGKLQWYVHFCSSIFCLRNIIHISRIEFCFILQPNIKILPPPKTTRNSRLKLHDSEMKKLLPTETSCRTIDEQPETERTYALNQL